MQNLIDTPHGQQAVEAAAKAIWEDSIRRAAAPIAPTWDELDGEWKDECRAKARAAMPHLLAGIAEAVRENYYNIDEGLVIADYIETLDIEAGNA